MSKHETWRTRKYWQSIGGLLIEEFVISQPKKEQAYRAVDGLIVLGEETRIHNSNTYDIAGKDVIVIQTKRSRLGMYLLGQAYFSKLVINSFKPRSVKSVAICGRNDNLMQELANMHHIEVIVIADHE